ncbi:MAG: hypothetical protein GYA21_11670 [Myxococcales bacterium]|nr:hypothetical protein [Myxococcales bacterium]
MPRVFIVTLVASSLVPWQTTGFEITLPWMDHPSSFEITETLSIDYHDDNLNGNAYDDRYGDIRNRLNLKLTVDDCSVSTRLDTVTFIRPPAIPAGENQAPYLDRYAPEKITAAYQGKTFKATLGDFYASIGRGLALQVRKIDELGLDTTLTGAKLELEFDRVELTALSGFSNPTNFEIYEKTVADTWDWLSAGRAVFRLGDRYQLGAHGVAAVIDPFGVNDSDEASRLFEHAFIGGASFEIPDLWQAGNLYLEFNWMGSTIPITEQKDHLRQSLAAYLSTNLFAGDWTFSAEFKALDEWELFTLPPSKGGRYRSDLRIDYLVPPLLEPEDLEISNNHDLSGGRLGVSLRPGGKDTLLKLSAALFYAKDLGEDLHRWIYNVWGGLEQRFLDSGKARLEVGWREERPDYHGPAKKMLYVNAGLLVPLGGRFSLDGHGFIWWVTEDTPTREYLKGEWTLTVNRAPGLAAGFILGLDSERAGKVSLDIIDDSSGRPIRQVFLAGTLQVNFKSRVVLRLLAGQLRGGLKCVGSCQLIPPFAGVRLETVLRF